ncbi:hypothetical protein C0991_011543 [Blastosporella zonata]|nr:hypothetical protein C0991_011543 [Blastosporella zonata]
MPTLLLIMQRYLYSIWWAFMPNVPRELQILKDSDQIDVTAFTRTVSVYYANKAMTRTAPSLRLVSLTALKIPPSGNTFEHEYTLLCLHDTNEKKHYVELHRGPAPSPPEDESKPGPDAKYRLKNRLRSPTNYTAILRGSPNKNHLSLTRITFPEDTRKTLLDVLIIAVTVNRQLYQYRMLDSNCFGHTELIMSLAESEFGAVRTQLEHSTSARTNHGTFASQLLYVDHFGPAKILHQTVKADMYELVSCIIH